MHYPWWYVPYLTAPMLIAFISVLHVLVSHYAVGGGIFLAVEVGHAYRTKNREYLDYLHGHAKFFVLVTVVFGAISGVGIWWTIGLASPLATEFLIRTFVFGWATEWVFFVVEMTAAFIFLYNWGRLSEKIHTAIGWIYAVAAWISLVLITGITAFMLNSGGWAGNPQARSFWPAFFNPQFLPQTVARTGGALLLSSLYVYLHASWAAPSAPLRNMVASRLAKPAFLGASLIVAGGFAWFCALPDAAVATLKAAAVLNALTVILFILTVFVFVLVYWGPYRNPDWLSRGFAISLFLFGVAAFSTGEFLREAPRKPFIVHNIVLGNQIMADEVTADQKNGFLQSGVWTKAFVAKYVPNGLTSLTQNNEKLSPKDFVKRDANRKLIGHALFMVHCNDCHAAEVGYSAVGPLLQGRPRDEVLHLVLKLGDSNYSMPPWCGTSDEAELLTDYLMTINTPRPSGTRPWAKPAGDSSDGDF
jgi:cytochrome bd-type quinol oxidase subunit 1